MYDINFFERYKPKPKKTNYYALAGLCLVALLVFAIIFFEIGFMTKQSELQTKIDEINTEISSPANVKLIKEIDEKNVHNIELSRVLERLGIVDSFMGAKNVVYSGLVGEISKSVPAKCFIRDISIGESSIMITGFADGYESVAQFQHQLRTIQRLTTIFNPNIEEDNANYSFSIAGKVKMEVLDEN